MPLPTQQMFEKNLNEMFKVKTDSGEEIILELSDVSEIRDRGPYDSFSIVFLGPDSMVLEQKIHEIAHEKLGTHSIFLVPIGKRGDRVEYQAVFSCKKP